MNLPLPGHSIQGMELRGVRVEMLVPCPIHTLTQRGVLRQVEELDKFADWLAEKRGFKMAATLSSRFA